MKHLKPLLTLLFVIIASAVVYFIIYLPESTTRRLSLSEKSLIQFDLDTIESFTLIRPDSSLTFERGTGRLWYITSPLEAEADKEPLYRLFLTLHESHINRIVDINPRNLEDYGLDDSLYCLAINFEDGSTDSLYVGYETPDRTMSYVKFASQNRILAVSNSLTDLLKRSVRFYRSRTLLNIIPDDVVSIEIIRSDQEHSNISLRGRNRLWRMHEPFEEDGDDFNILNMLKSISERMKIDFVEESTDDLSKYGLDDPNTIFRVTFRDMPPKMLMIGNRLTERGKTGHRYAKQFDNDLIFTMENSVYLTLNQPPGYFVKSNHVRFDRNNANKIIVETSHEPIIFVKDRENNWNLITPFDKNVDNHLAVTLFSLTFSLRTNDIYKFDPAMEDIRAAGLDNPQAVISVFIDDNLVSKVEFGRSFYETAHSVYFRTEGSPSIFITRTNLQNYLNYILREVYGG